MKGGHFQLMILVAVYVSSSCVVPWWLPEFWGRNQLLCK